MDRAPSDMPGAPAPVSQGKEPLGVLRRALRVVAPLALLAVVAAVLVNWFVLTQSSVAAPSGGTASAETTSGPAGPQPVELETPAIEMLPGNILQFETIAHQAIPGTGSASAESIYKTLNMNVEAQIPVVVYARSEGFASDADARARVDELMRAYTVEREELLLGQTPAVAGYLSDQSSYAYGWVRGGYATFVKASFSAWTPAHTYEIAKRQGVAVAEMVEIYQRTGSEGVAAEAAQEQ